MTHIGVPSLGYRIEADGKVLAYTGDTGPCDNAVDLARDADLFLCEATYQNHSELTYFHLSALAGGRTRRRRGRRTARPDPHHAGPRSRRLARAGRRAVPWRDRRRRAGHGDRGGRVTRPDGRDAASLRPVGLRGRLPGVGRGVGAVLDGEDPRALRRVGVRRSASVAPRLRQGLGDGRVLDAARRRRPSGRSAR